MPLFTTVVDPEVIESLRELAGDDADFLPQMIELFLSAGKEKLAALVEHVEKGNFREVAALAHQLKSSSGNLGATGLFHLFSQLETASGNANGGEVSTTLAAVQALFPRVEAELSAIMADARHSA